MRESNIIYSVIYDHLHRSSASINSVQESGTSHHTQLRCKRGSLTVIGRYLRQRIPTWYDHVLDALVLSCLRVPSRQPSQRLWIRWEDEKIVQKVLHTWASQPGHEAAKNVARVIVIPIITWFHVASCPPLYSTRNSKWSDIHITFRWESLVGYIFFWSTNKMTVMNAVMHVLTLLIRIPRSTLIGQWAFNWSWRSRVLSVDRTLEIMYVVMTHYEVKRIRCWCSQIPEYYSSAVSNDGDLMYILCTSIPWHPSAACLATVRIQKKNTHLSSNVQPQRIALASRDPSVDDGGDAAKEDKPCAKPRVIYILFPALVTFSFSFLSFFFFLNPGLWAGTSRWASEHVYKTCTTLSEHKYISCMTNLESGCI